MGALMAHPDGQKTALVVRVLRLGPAADVCLVKGHLKRSRRLHGLWNQTGSFRRGLGSTHRFHLLLVIQVGSRLWLMHHVRLGQRPPPTGELQRDAVWVLKVDGPDKGVLVGLSGHILRDTRSVR